VLGAGLLTAVPAAPARAAIGDKPLITWNMQGSNSANTSKWTFDIGGFVNGWVTPPIVALQEAGSNEPAHAPGTGVQFLSGGQLAPLPATIDGVLPPYQNTGGPRQVRHSQWASGGVTHDVYFLQTDPNGDSWGGGRVNLAMVTERAADEVVIVPNPLGQTTAFAARATLGLRFGGTWYFTVHALSRSQGSDAPRLLTNISAFVNARGQNEDWIAMGDWNRTPQSMQGLLPTNAETYATGRATHQAGGELDWAVYSNGGAAGVNVQLRPVASSDHTPVQVGQLRAGAEPTDAYNTDRALENMQAGGVLDAFNGLTQAGTPIISSRRNGAQNQSWDVEEYNDRSIRFVGRQSNRCITATGIGGSDGLAATLQDCTNGPDTRWVPEYLGNDEVQLHSQRAPDQCLNIRGGQKDPNDTKQVILYACQNTPNSRFVFTPANATKDISRSPRDLSQDVPGPITLENMKAGGVADVKKEKTGNNTALISYHRTGGGNQGWKVGWHNFGETVVFQGVASDRCIDIHNSGDDVGPGRELVIFECNGQPNQEWRPEQLDNGQMLLHSVAHPELCMDIEDAPVNPNDGRLIVWNCTGDSNQQWLLTPFDPSGDPEEPGDPRDPGDLIVLPDPGKPAERTAYFPSWSVYANQFFVKNLDTQGIASKLTTLSYAFENIHPTELTCFANNKSGSPDESDTTGNDGSSDAWADYQMGYTTENSIDGTADSWAQPLKGNFNQLKKLKAKHPNLKVVVSLGGWTYSKYFSDVAATDASRKKFVSSCVDLYIKGNLPKIGDDPAGGPGAAAGVFDGFDIDWEFPASANGHTGNHSGAQDTENYTLLLAEFRRQLNGLGGKQYRLTAAVPSGPSDIDKVQVAKLAETLDMVNVMTYDMHGAWEADGPTNSQAPLYESASSPAEGTGLTVNDAINHYLMQGLPAGKISMGVPFYARGWTGVPDKTKHGLYQSVTGPTEPFQFSQQAGVAMYKELKAAGKLNKVYFDQTSKSSWAYDGSNFYTIESPESLKAKRQYIKAKGLGGVMMYSLEADDSSSTLLKAATGFVD
jgi:GH18 family chitinase